MERFSVRFEANSSIWMIFSIWSEFLLWYAILLYEVIYFRYVVNFYCDLRRIISDFFYMMRVFRRISNIFSCDIKQNPQSEANFLIWIKRVWRYKEKFRMILTEIHYLKRNFWSEALLLCDLERFVSIIY